MDEFGVLASKFSGQDSSGNIPKSLLMLRDTQELRLKMAGGLNLRGWEDLWLWPMGTWQDLRGHVLWP